MFSVSKLQGRKSATLALTREFDAGAVGFSNANVALFERFSSTDRNDMSVLRVGESHLCWSPGKQEGFSPCSGLQHILRKSVGYSGLTLKSLMRESCLV